MASRAVTVAEVERIVLDVPFHPRCWATAETRVSSWSVIELCKVTTSAGVVGLGETVADYTWGRSRQAQFDRVRGGNLFDHLWDDNLGAGLQMALFDAAGKALDVPCHRLLGPLHREECPVSWWAQDMPPEAWAEEARAALAHGFTTMKVKARPWFDLDRQLAAVTAAVPPFFRVDVDFNGLLLGPDLAAPLIDRLERTYPILAIVESPIPQEDVAGNALLRRKIRSPIAMHIGSPPVMTAIREGVCDGFVLGGGATQVMRDGALASRAGMPFWLQLVGSGLTTAFSVHLGAVLDQARWPAIPCLNIYSDPLVTGLKTEGGCIRVPQAPGLGVELDWEAVERFRVAPEYRKPGRRQIHAIYWPDGRTSWYPDGRYRADFLAGRLPPFLSGVSLETRLDDGTEGFAREYQDRFPQAR